jgi:tetratricopeptide (TPR) repeat protein
MAGKKRSDKPMPRRRRLWAAVLLVGTAGGIVFFSAKAFLAHRYHQAARQALQVTDLDEALRQLERSLAVQPDDAQVRLLAARTARRLDSYAAAGRHLREYERIQGADKVSEREWFLQGVQQGDVAGHEQTLRSLAAQDPRQAPFVLESLAKGYLNCLSWGDAVDCLSFALERWPGHAPLRVLRGRAYESTHQKESALADYRRAVEAAPRYREGRLRLALALQEGGFNHEARAHFAFLYQEAPEEPEVLLGFARCCSENHDLEFADQLLQRLAERHPHFVPGLVEAGRLSLYLQHGEQAERLLLRAQAISPSHLEAQRLLEACYEARGKGDELAAVRRRLHETHRGDLQLVRLLDRCRDFPGDARVRFDIGAWILQHGDEPGGLRWWFSSLYVDEHCRPAHEALADYFERTGQPRWAAHHRQRASPVASSTRAAP